MLGCCSDQIIVVKNLKLNPNSQNLSDLQNFITEFEKEVFLNKKGSAWVHRNFSHNSVLSKEKATDLFSS